jgi:hypothetical protein
VDLSAITEPQLLALALETLDLPVKPGIGIKDQDKEGD